MPFPRYLISQSHMKPIWNASACDSLAWGSYAVEMRYDDELYPSDYGPHALFRMRAPNGELSTVLVETKSRLDPRDVLGP